MEVDRFATLLRKCEAFAWAIRKRLSRARRRAVRSEGSSPTSLTNNFQQLSTAFQNRGKSKWFHRDNAVDYVCYPDFFWTDFWMNFVRICWCLDVLSDVGLILVPWQVPWLPFQRFPIDVPWWLIESSKRWLGSNFGHVLAALTPLIRSNILE